MPVKNYPVIEALLRIQPGRVLTVRNNSTDQIEYGADWVQPYPSESEIDSAGSDYLAEQALINVRQPTAMGKLIAIADVAKTIKTLADARTYIEGLGADDTARAKEGASRAIYAISQLMRHLYHTTPEFFDTGE
jgi:hypothetical protein